MNGFSCFLEVNELSQYFENDLTLKSNIKFLHFMFHGESFTFQTDTGVFSKDAVDKGSIALLEVVRSKPFSGPILDVGCGYGVLGIVLARLSNERVTMFDVNEKAVELTKKNLILNKISNAKVFVSDSYESLTPSSFDTIVINPPIRAGKNVVHKLLLEGVDYLSIGGTLYFVIRKAHGAKSAAKMLKSHDLPCELVKKDKGYYIYQVSKAKKIN